MREEASELAQFLAGRDVACPKCSYSLRGLKGEACPECGLGLSLANVRAGAPMGAFFAAAAGLAVAIGYYTLAVYAAVIISMSYGATSFGLPLWAAPVVLLLLLVAGLGILLLGRQRFSRMGQKQQLFAAVACWVCPAGLLALLLVAP